MPSVIFFFYLPNFLNHFSGHYNVLATYFAPGLEGLEQGTTSILLIRQPLGPSPGKGPQLANLVGKKCIVSSSYTHLHKPFSTSPLISPAKACE